MKRLIAIMLMLLSLSVLADESLDLLNKAKGVLVTDAEESIALFNSILLMPKNLATEEAQFYIGMAYEQAGKINKAKIENKLFLVEYPNSDRYGAVKRRQLALELQYPDVAISKEYNKEPKTGSDRKFSAGYSYYRSSTGASTSGRLSYFAREGQYNAKLTVKASNKHRTDLVYVDFTDTFTGYGIKAGKQNGIYGIKHSFTGILAESPRYDNTRVYFASDLKDSTLALEYKRDYIAYISNKGPGVEIRSFQENVSTTVLADKNTTLLSSTYYSKDFTLYTLYNRQYSNKMILFGYSQPISKNTSLYVDLQNFKIINLHITNPYIASIYLTYSRDMYSVTALHSRAFDNFRLDALLRYSVQSLGYTSTTFTLRGLYKYSDMTYIESQLSVARTQDASAYIGIRQEF